MDRRTFLSTLGAGVLAVPPAAQAQSRKTRPKIGWLTPAPVEAPWRAFREALTSLGYIEGRNVMFEQRSADDHVERLPHLAAELVSSNVDVIVAVSPLAIVA